MGGQLSQKAVRPEDLHRVIQVEYYQREAKTTLAEESMPDEILPVVSEVEAHRPWKLIAGTNMVSLSCAASRKDILPQLPVPSK